jgi:hypothetical protein
MECKNCGRQIHTITGRLTGHAAEYVYGVKDGDIATIWVHDGNDNLCSTSGRDMTWNRSIGAHTFTMTVATPVAATTGA